MIKRILVSLANIESPDAARGDLEMTTDKRPDSSQADRNLLQRVKAHFHQRGYGLHRILDIRVERGGVVIQGRVPTFHLRQIAVDCIKRVAGVTQVVDLIEVVDDSRQRRVNNNSDEEQESSAISTQHGGDASYIASTTQDPHRLPVRNRHRLTSTRG